jgi:hypothetical protein
MRVSGVGQLVQIDHMVISVSQQMADQVRADETAATGDQNFHES